MVSGKPSLTTMISIEILVASERDYSAKVGVLGLDGYSEVRMEPEVDLPVNLADDFSAASFRLGPGQFE